MLMAHERAADRSRVLSPAERRKGRPRRARFTLADFHACDERNLSLSELSDLSGIHKDKLLSLIPTHLDAFMPAGFNRWFVTYREAKRFLRELRLVED
jgi:hypothetical protein